MGTEPTRLCSAGCGQPASDHDGDCALDDLAYFAERVHRYTDAELDALDAQAYGEMDRKRALRWSEIGRD